MNWPHYSRYFNQHRGKRRGSLLAAALVLACGVPAAHAQQDEPQAEPQGIEQGNYNIRQSVEFGGRIASISGDAQAYDTFVNLQSGARLLGFTTEMQSLNHHGTLFDRLYFSNFGYGGDPNNVSSLRVAKNKWYNFDAMFRRDENAWNYSLLANPLNPTAPFANGPAGFAAPTCTACIITGSPHSFDTHRRMGDYNLLVLPDSKIRFRLGYSRNVADGPSFSDFHQGTEQVLFQNWKTTVNTYRLGVDFRILPRTSISYDQIWSFYKGDTGFTDNNQIFRLPPQGGAPSIPVDLGISFNSAANQPCAGTFVAGGFVNPACSAYLSYMRSSRTRTHTPTEQISLQSNYWKSLDLSARFSYSGGDSTVYGFNETWAGREARTNLRNSLVTGPIAVRRLSAAADFGATWRITEKLSFIDSFHFSNWRDPGEFDASNCSYFSTNLLTAARVFTANGTAPVNCVSPLDGIAGTPTHSTSSGPDVGVSVTRNFLKQDEKTNLAELEYQFTPKMGARLGFRFRHRAIDDSFFSALNEVFFPDTPARGVCALVNPAQPLSAANLPSGCALNSNGSISFVTPGPESDGSETLINEYAGVFGFWARPTAKWRISFDTDIMSADNAFTRISPRQSQEYRVRTTYKAATWATLNGSMTIWEGRDNVDQVNNLQHNRTFGFAAILQPTEKIALDLGYDYNDVFSQILICFTSTAAPKGLAQCPGVIGLVQQLSTYTNKSHFGHLDLMVMPVTRLALHVGADLTGTSGSALLVITPSVPSGSLNSKYLRPHAGLDYRFAKSWTAKGYWDYYGYHEDPSAVPQDIYAPRNFRANLVTLSLRYAF